MVISFKIAELGIKEMTGAKAKGGFGSFISNLYEKAMIPAGGKVLHKAGTSMKK